MKKPALIETTVRLFPHKEFEAATTQTAIKGHATGSLCHSSPKSRENLLFNTHNPSRTRDGI